MNKTQWKWNKTGMVVLMASALLGATGCLQLEMDVELHEKDAGATVTERLRFTRTLLDLNRGHAEGNEGIARHLKRAAAQARMAHMGEGIALASHEVVELDGGSRESVAVYRIPDIENLRLPNPFLQDGDPAPMTRFVFGGGGSSIRLRPADDTPRPEDEMDEADYVPAATPRDIQMYRDLQPIFADLMQDFKIKVTLTIPDQPRARGRPAGDRTVELLSFHYRDLDGQARRFIENQEAMLALMQFQMTDDAIVAHTREFTSNPLVPVHRGRRTPYHSSTINIRPTPYLAERF